MAGGTLPHAVPEELRAEIEEMLLGWSEHCAEYREHFLTAGMQVEQYMPGVYGLTLLNGQKFKLVVEKMPRYQLAEEPR